MVEIMVVCAIIGILAAAVVGNYFAMRSTKNMHIDGRDLISEIQLMRLEAVKRNTCVMVVLNLGAAPPADLTGALNRGSYTIFSDDGRGVNGVPPLGTPCDGILTAGETQIATNPNPPRTVLVRNGVALTQSPVAATVFAPGPPPAGDPGFRVGGVTDFFTSISFNARSMVTNRVGIGARAIVFRNDPNPANATWWGRVIVTDSGSMQFQTNNNPANETNWSR